MEGEKKPDSRRAPARFLWHLLDWATEEQKAKPAVEGAGGSWWEVPSARPVDGCNRLAGWQAALLDRPDGFDTALADAHTRTTATSGTRLQRAMGEENAARTAVTQRSVKILIRHGDGGSLSSRTEVESRARVVAQVIAHTAGCRGLVGSWSVLDSWGAIVDSDGDEALQGVRRCIDAWAD
ncbi:hypothetical protein EG329_004236 [Mollisiaceae sp. DMI_Dod_QoI]|nr:hypothetical protein EG329_004236 [Helotiales sp. DMI_Dod_QoI]